MYAKGDYVHWKGWGLAKIVEHRTNRLSNEIEYRVNTKTHKNQKFQMGIKTDHPQELTKVSNEDAKNYISSKSYI